MPVRLSEPLLDNSLSRTHVWIMAWVILVICGVVLMGLSFYDYVLRGDRSALTLGQIMQVFGALLIMSLILNYLLT